MDLNIKALEKLVDYAASGIGSVAGSMLAPWRAEREALAKHVAATGDADALRIQAEAQAEARSLLVSQDTHISGELDIASTVKQRIQFQEQKRQVNIASVVKEAAGQLGEREVTSHEPDHDWTARFFNDVQDVSSEEMRALWARVLAGEVERAGSTSIRTLAILKNLDQGTAGLFRKFCSASLFLGVNGKELIDARVPSLGGNAASNSLEAYGLSFGVLNILNEHGLIISDYNSWRDIGPSIGLWIDGPAQLLRLPFRFQDRYWILMPTSKRAPDKNLKLSGVAMTRSGRELSSIVGLEPMDDFLRALSSYFLGKQLQMKEVESPSPQIFPVGPQDRH